MGTEMSIHITTTPLLLSIFVTITMINCFVSINFTYTTFPAFPTFNSFTEDLEFLALFAALAN